MSKDRGDVIEEFVEILDEYLAVDVTDGDRARVAADLLETAGKRVLPYHHVRVDCESI